MFSIKTAKFLSRFSISSQHFLVARLLAWRTKVCLEKKFLPGKPVQIRVYDLVNAGPRHRFTTAQFLVSNCLALGYGCGWKKFIVMALTLAGLDITRDDPEFIEQVGLDGATTKVPGYGKRSREIVKEFRTASPKVVAFWNRLDGAFKSSIGGDFTLTLPSGRKMVYRNVRCAVTMEHSEELKRPVRKEVWTAKTDKPRYFYGGKLVENCVQAVARDVFGEQIVNLDKKGVPCLFTVHDEGVFEVDKEVSAREIENEMSRCPDWLPGCPIGAVAEEVEHYKK